jgi:hypothetical protein
MGRPTALPLRTIRSTLESGDNMKDVSYIQRKIEKAGIYTVASVRESGLDFVAGASQADKDAAQAIFDAYVPDNSTDYHIAKRMIEIQALLAGVKEVEKDITIPNGLKTELTAEYDTLKAQFLA